MHRVITCLVVALVPLWAANAQPLKPNTPSILQWTPEQQREGYRSIETIYKTATIARGEAVRALGNADRTLELSYTRDGRNWTIDDFMKAFNVSGLMVLKDGKVLVERYGLGRQPQDRWISFSIAKSVTSTLVGAAIQDGKIKSLDDPVTLYIPELKGSGYDGVNLRQMLGFQLISALVERHEKALLRQHFTDAAVDRVGGHWAQFFSRERISLWSC